MSKSENGTAIKRFILSPLLVLLYVCPCCARAELSSTARKQAEEPFDTFRLVDSRLSTLQKQLAEVRNLQAAADSGDPNRAKQWANAAHQMTRSAATIEAIARKLKLRYRGTRQRYGARLFRLLELRASSMRLQTVHLTGSKGANARTKAIQKTSELLLTLIEQFQAISGGYENSHCKTFACCTPKKTGRSLGCKWECVPARTSCRKGFLSSSVPVSR